MVYRLDVSFAVGRQSRWRTTTRQSAPLRRIGTFDLAVGAACAFSLSIAGQVLTFHTKAWSSFAPPTCRMPLGQASGFSRADPGGRGTPRFRHRLIGFRGHRPRSARAPGARNASQERADFFPSRVFYPSHSRPKGPGMTMPPISGAVPACDHDGVSSAAAIMPRTTDGRKQARGFRQVKRFSRWLKWSGLLGHRNPSALY